MHKIRKKYLMTAAIAASLANGYWSSLSGTHGGQGADLAPVLMSVASVWVGYFSLAWLFAGMRSK